MSATVIDRLVVELGLDPKKYSAGTADAQARTEKFRKTIAGLGIDETKLDDKQKKGLESLRKVATQSQRTGKELQAAGTAGDEFWSVLKKGAIGFGAALGIVGLQRMMTDTIATNSALARTAPLLGMNAKALDTLNKAVREATGGTGAGVAGTMQGLSDSLQGLASGTIPEGLIQSLAMLSMRSGGPMTALRHPDGSALTPDELLKNIADEVQKVGPAAAHSILGPAGFDDEIIQLLGKGKSGFQSALDAAAPNTLDKKDYDNAQEAAKSMNQLSDAIGKLRDVLVLAAAPRLIRDLTNLTTTMHLLSGDIGLDEYKKRIDEADDTLFGPSHKQARMGAAAISALREKQNQAPTNLPAGTPAYTGSGRFAFPRRTVIERGIQTWTTDDESVRLGQLMMAGMNQDAAIAQVMQEEKSGKAFSTFNANPKESSGSVTPSGTSRGARDNNPMDLMFAKQDGATGDTYTGADGKTRTLARFATPEDGAAAGRSQLMRYFSRGINTTSDIANTFAPSSDGNNTAAYIKSMDEAMNVGPHQKLSADSATLDKLVEVMSRLETGTKIVQNGPITITAPSGDPKTIARGLHGAIIAQADSGPR